MKTSICIKISITLVTLSLFFWNKVALQNTSAAVSLPSASEALMTDRQSHNDTIPDLKPPRPGLAPGQAKVRASIVAFENSNRGHETNTGIVSLEIKQILGYGAATPPIAVSDTLKVRLRNPEEAEIRIGKIVSAVLSYQERPNNTFGHALRWTILNFEEDSY